MSEFEMLQVLKRRYKSDAYAVVPQVRNTTGFSSKIRTADAIAVSLWPSRGIGLEGFEFKDSRTDWQKELRDPAKAEEIGRYCEKWWVLTSKPGIVRDGELPKTWGLMEIDDGAIKVKAKAPNREAQPPTWNFVASLMRAAVECTFPAAEIDKRIEAAKTAGWAEGNKHGESMGERVGKHKSERLAQLEKLVAEFEKASGFHIDRYRPDGQKIGKLAKLLGSDYGGLIRDLTGVRNTLAANIREIDEAIAVVPKIESEAA